MGSHGLSASFTVDAGYKASAVSVLMLFEAQRLSITHRRDFLVAVGCMLWLGRPFREFPPYGRDNVTKSLFDPSLVKTNLIDPMNVRELFRPFLK